MVSDETRSRYNEDRVLRDRFRDNAEDESLPDWPVAEFLEMVEEFLEEYVEGATEYQDTLVAESEVRTQLVC